MRVLSIFYDWTSFTIWFPFNAFVKRIFLFISEGGFFMHIKNKYLRTSINDVVPSIKIQEVAKSKKNNISKL